MKITIQLSTESSEMLGKLSEEIGASPTLIVNRMVNSQLESLNGLYEMYNPLGSGPVSLGIPHGSPHQPRSKVSNPLLEPEQDFAEFDEFQRYDDSGC